MKLSILPVNPSVRPSCLFLCINNLLPFLAESRSGSIDLSNATRLKHVAFRPDPWTAEWTATALRTITPEHRDLRQITIHIPDYLITAGGATKTIEEPICEQWLDLDHLLAQLWESHSIRPKVVCVVKANDRVYMIYCVGRLLQEITGRRIINLVEYSFEPHYAW